MDKVEVVLGDNVCKIWNDYTFKAKWETLFNACPWVSIFQSKAFVFDWYKYHHLEFTP